MPRPKRSTAICDCSLTLERPNALESSTGLPQRSPHHQGHFVRTEVPQRHRVHREHHRVFSLWSIGDPVDVLQLQAFKSTEARVQCLSVSLSVRSVTPWCFGPGLSVEGSRLIS
jgi:hypothetical protein